VKRYKKYLAMLFLWPFFYTIFGSAFAETSVIKSTPSLSKATAAAIGKKIWQNECLGEISGLTSWNVGEGFASLGIGHSIWYPAGPKGIFEESFPNLVQYMRRQGVSLPRWLDQPKIPHCPWQTREEFMLAIKNNDVRMLELRKLLVKTIPVQTQYLIYRLKAVLPDVLESIPKKERGDVQRKIDQLMQTSNGVYALVDYVNFKGRGISLSERYQGKGWGLVQALVQMQQAPKELTSNAAFTWAAGEVLKRRVANAPDERKAREAKWLPGWLKRTDTYRKTNITP